MDGRDGARTGKARVSRMEKEQSNFERKLVRIKQSSFWDAFRFTKDGRFKSTLLIYSFSLSFIFIAIYVASYWLLIDPIEFGLRPYAGAQLRTLAESFIPAILGALVCCIFYFTSHDKKMVLFTYGWLILFVLVLGAFAFVSFTPEEFSIACMLALRFLVPPLGVGIFFAVLLYIRSRRNDPFKRYESLPDWQKNR